MPNKDSRVCNLHFVDGEPTAENPDPTLRDCVDIARGASVIHDNGWYEINENSNFCMNASCLKSSKTKMRKSKKLSEKIQELSEKVKLLEVQTG